MSLCHDYHDPDSAQESAAKLYEQSPDVVDRLAEREDEVGAVFQAIREVAEGDVDA